MSPVDPRSTIKSPNYSLDEHYRFCFAKGLSERLERAQRKTGEQPTTDYVPTECYGSPALQSAYRTGQQHALNLTIWATLNAQETHVQKLQRDAGSTLKLVDRAIDGVMRKGDTAQPVAQKKEKVAPPYSPSDIRQLPQVVHSACTVYLNPAYTKKTKVERLCFAGTILLPLSAAETQSYKACLQEKARAHCTRPASDYKFNALPIP